MEIKRRPALFVKKPSSINLTCPAMSFPRIERGKQLVTEKTLPHHALSAAYEFCHPHQVLAGRQSELKLDLMEQVKSVSAEGIEAVTGCFH